MDANEARKLKIGQPVKWEEAGAESKGHVVNNAPWGVAIQWEYLKYTTVTYHHIQCRHLEIDDSCPDPVLAWGIIQLTPGEFNTVMFDVKASDLLKEAHQAELLVKKERPRTLYVTNQLLWWADNAQSVTWYGHNLDRKEVRARRGLWRKLEEWLKTNKINYSYEKGMSD